MNKYIIASLLITVAIFGGYFFPFSSHTDNTIYQQVGAVGDTNSTQRIASCVLDMSTTSATFATTTTSTNGCLYNTDSKTRIITSIDYYISNIGSANTSVATTTWIMGTSSDVYNVPAGQILSTSIATTTANGVITGRLFIASTTPGAAATFVNREWPSGTNLNLQQNASSTAVATIKVTYFINN